MTTPDRDVLISRIVDQEATVEDWAQLRDLASDDPDVWRDVAEAHMRHADLERAIAPILGAADDVDIPTYDDASIRLTERIGVVTTWAGWGVAAAVVLAWLGLVGLGDPGSTGGAQLATPVPVALGDSPEQALEHYIDLGRRQNRVLGEAPHVILQTAPASEGRGFEVIFVRQILERQYVDDLYRMSTDEAGRQVPVPLESAPQPFSTTLTNGPM